MREDADRIKLAILKALHESGGTAGAARLARRLAALGYDLQPRTVRHYLLALDGDHLTRLVARRKGRALTPRGLQELARANVVEKVGFVASRIDTLSYQMTYRLRTGQGSLITNVAAVDLQAESDIGRELRPVFERGLGMGNRMAIARPGQSLAGFEVPDRTIAVGTVCSVTLNGVFLGEGIPVVSRYGGLLEMQGGQPFRFVQLIEYSGTTLDPLETFIRAGMTTVRECARTGEGLIGASFREVPAVAIEEVERLRRRLEEEGLGGILLLGRPNRPLLDIPVTEGRAGMVVAGGLNPIAALHEVGVRVTIRSLAGLEDAAIFRPYWEVCDPRDGSSA